MAVTYCTVHGNQPPRRQTSGAMLPALAVLLAGLSLVVATSLADLRAAPARGPWRVTQGQDEPRCLYEKIEWNQSLH